MERNNKELTTLEYLIRLRAFSYGKKCWIYLTVRQRLAFLGIMSVMEDIECDGKKTIPLSWLINETKTVLDENITRFKKMYGYKIRNSFSKDAIRSVIYLGIPLYFSITQHGRVKVISITTKTKEFIGWKNKSTVTKETGEDVPNSFLWMSVDKINFIEDTFPPPNNNIAVGVENNPQNNIKTPSHYITNKPRIKH